MPAFIERKRRKSLNNNRLSLQIILKNINRFMTLAKIQIFK